MAPQLPQWAALAPAFSMAGAAFLLLIADIITPEDGDGIVLAGVSVTGAVVSLGFSVWYLLAGTGQPRANAESVGGAIDLFDASLIVDSMSLFFSAIIASVVVLVVLGSFDYLRNNAYQAEYYSLVMLAATGMVMVTVANSFVTAFIAIELVSLPSYALVASLKHNRGSVEAGLKYFLIGALSSAIFVYGISLIYVATGSLQFDAVRNAIGDTSGGILGLGVTMILGGIAFKISAVPFNFWAPEAYEGAPAPVAGFISSASKAAGFVLAFRIGTELLFDPGLIETVNWLLAVQILAVLTMTIANFAALKQEKVKRMLAYSSVGHAGYVLIGLGALSVGADGNAFILGSGMAHLAVYGFMNTGAFLVVALTEYWDLGRTIEDYYGLGTKAPFASAAMTIFLFSLAGLPAGGGFFSKFYLLRATVQGDALVLGAALILNSVVSLFYYSRVVRAMWVKEPADDLEISEYPTGLYAAIALAALITVLLLPGFGPVADTATSAAEMFVSS